MNILFALLLFIPSMTSLVIWFIAMNNFIGAYRKTNNMMKKNDPYENSFLYVLTNPYKHIFLFNKEIYRKQEDQSVERARKKAQMWHYISIVMFFSTSVIFVLILEARY